MNLFNALGQGANLFAKSVWASTLPGRYQMAMQAAQQRHARDNSFEAMLRGQGSPGQGGIQISQAPTAAQADTSVTPSQPAGRQLSDAQVALARQAYASCHPEQAWSIIHPPEDYTVGNTRYSGADNSILSHTPPSGIMNGSGASAIVDNGVINGGILGPESQPPGPDGFIRATPPPKPPDKFIPDPQRPGEWMINPLMIEYERQLKDAQAGAAAAHRAPPRGRGSGRAPPRGSGAPSPAWETF